jgi:hypothetical protein
MVSSVMAMWQQREADSRSVEQAAAERAAQVRAAAEKAAPERAAAKRARAAAALSDGRLDEGNANDRIAQLPVLPEPLESHLDFGANAGKIAQLNMAMTRAALSDGRLDEDDANDREDGSSLGWEQDDNVGRSWLPGHEHKNVRRDLNPHNETMPTMR